MTKYEFESSGFILTQPCPQEIGDSKFNFIPLSVWYCIDDQLYTYIYIYIKRKQSETKASVIKNTFDVSITQLNNICRLSKQKLHG